MPANKDFKRLVRARMQKTGEPYTAARVHLLKTKPFAAAPDYATVAGKSDTILKEKTGRTWNSWVAILDRTEAYTWPHRDIAKYLRGEYQLPGWWAQMVTVGYERIKGLRAIGQRRDGSFEASKSKTIAVPLARLYGAFHNSRIRARWLPKIRLTIRSTTPEKSMRIAWPDGTRLEVGFTAKGTAKSQVALAHGKLPDRNTAAELKRYWTDRLAALEEVLTRRTRA